MKRVPLVAGALVAGMLFAGCSAPATTPATAPAPASTAAQKPALGNAVPGSEVDKQALASFVTAGVKSMKTSHMSVVSKVTMSGKAVTVKMDGDIDLSDPARPRAAVTMDLMAKMEMVMDGEDYYIRMAALGPDWMKTTKAELSKSSSSSSIDFADQMNLTSEYVMKAEKAVYVGEETVDGVKTKRYTLTMPAADLLGASGMTSAVSSVPFDMYLDAQGVIRKTHFALADPETTADVLVTKVNQPVSITVPTGAKPFLKP